MKHIKRTPEYSTQVVCTDGSTLTLDYLFAKNDVFLINDLNNNSIYLSPYKGKEKIESRSKIKQKSLRFDFMQLVKGKKDKK